MKEKRKLIRFSISLKVEYTVDREPNIIKKGKSKDISAGGIHLITEERLRTGSKLALKLFIPDALNPVHLNGTVLSSKEIEINRKLSYSENIEFGEIEEDNKNTFLKFLCNLMYGKIGKEKEVENQNI